MAGSTWVPVWLTTIRGEVGVSVGQQRESIVDLDLVFTEGGRCDADQLPGHACRLGGQPAQKGHSAQVGR